GARRMVDPRRPHAFFLEQEPDDTGRCRSSAVIFLTNRECPWRCLMCDLWQDTLTDSVPAGAIPGQIQHAFAGLGPADQVKLYNSGSFFDRRAIPPGDHSAIAALLRPFQRV